MKAALNGFNPVYSEESPAIDDISAMSGYAVLEFGAPWCGHCKAAIPAIQQVLAELSLPHVKVFDGKGKPLGRHFQVKLWPTLILLCSGREIARLVRPQHVSQVKKLLADAENAESGV